MSKKTSGQIEQLLEDALRELGYNCEWAEEDEQIIHSYLGGNGKFPNPQDRLKFIEQDGGGEGGGEYVYGVFQLDGVFYKAEWNYYSHCGYNFESLEFTEVKPEEKTITVYNPI